MKWGKLAEAFNKMAAKLRAYRQSTTEQILQAQQTTESALRAFPDPILVFSPEKEIQLQNAAAELFSSKSAATSIRWDRFRPISIKA
jgi:NtrC-family two-component system sensor histidine kinase KinB